MDKKHSDHIEDRIRQASNDIFVPVNEEAWKKMEVLLDNAFQKKRRRGGIWWWFFGVLLVAGIAGGVYLFQKSSPTSSKNSSANLPGSSDLPASASKKAESGNVPLGEQYGQAINTDQQKQASKNNETGKNKYLPGEPSGSLVTADRKVHASIVPEVGKKNLRPTNSFSKKSGHLISKFTPAKNIVSGFNSKKGTRFPNKGQSGISADSKMNVAGQGDNKTNYNKTNDDKTDTNNATTGNKKSSADSLQNLLSNGTKPLAPLIIQDSSDQQNTVAKKSPPVNLGKTSSRGFYFMVAAAADASGIKSISIDNIKPVYGAGLGYRFNKKLSIQTGFYKGKKIYKAGPGDYKVKPGSYVAKIISADAECVIYDIPLTIKYDFFQRRRYNIYATSGLSSFILKRETYDMHFFNPMGTYRHMAYTYKNNKNYLSVFNFSLGFEHKISNAIFVQAEPYIKLPIAGLGEGDVKLYSAGLQLGFKYQPFTNKKRKK